MNPKGLAVLIAAIVVFSSLFFFFHIIPPTGKVPPPHIKIPKQPPPINGSFFENQTVSPSILDVNGADVFNFTYTGNATTKINGFLYNASDGAQLIGVTAWISLYPAAAEYPVTSNGYYAFYALRAGSGQFYIKVPGYSKKEVSLDLTGKTIWLNLSLRPAHAYSVSGITIYKNGSIASSVGITFSGYFSSYSVTSSVAGKFSLSMDNDSYLISVVKKDVNPTPKPYVLNITGGPVNNLTLILYPTNVKYNVSGWITNRAGVFLQGATVSSPNDNSSTLTNATGYYILSVLNGYDSIIAVKKSYAPNETTVFVAQNLTNINLTLYNLDPFNGSGGSINPGLYNGTSGLGNSSSQVNYSNKSVYVLVGFIKDSYDGLPVADTTVNFIINVNGSYYDEKNVTTVNGSYAIGFSYSGTYRILVSSGFYNNTFLNVVISKPVTWDNFSLNPLKKFIYVVSGEITNYYNGVPVDGAKVSAYLVGDPAYSISNVTGTNGLYSIKLPASNYTIHATATDYNSNTTSLFFLNRNMTINLALKPIYWNPQQWNGSGPIAPGTNGSQVSSNLSGSGGYSSSHFYNITLHFINASSGGNASLTTFLLFYRIGNVTYYKILTSNSSGFVDLGAMEAGKYSFYVISNPYDSKAFLFNITANSSKTVDLTPKYLISLQVNLYDYAIPTGQNQSVPVVSLSVTNSLLPIPVNALQTLGGTLFSINAWNGTFNLSYVNISFIPWNKSITISLTPFYASYPVYPIGAVINYNTSTDWYYHSNLSPANTRVMAGIGSFLVPLRFGQSEIFVNVSSSSHTYTKYVNLTAGNPVIQLFLNISDQTSTVNLFSFIRENATTGIFDYNGTVSPESEIYGLNISFDLFTNSMIYVNTVLTPFTYINHPSAGGNYSQVTFASPVYVPSISSEIELITSLSGTNLKPMQIYYYEVSFT